MDPDVVAGVDDLAKRLAWSRSKLIQDVVVRVVHAFKPMIMKKKLDPKRNPLLKMSGAGGESSGRVSENIDEIYDVD